MDFKDELIKIFNNYNIQLNDIQCEQFKQFYNMIVEYNKKINLTTIVSQTDFIIKHLLDSVLIIDNLNKDATLLDIGAGAGFPSIPIKIMRPDISITMIDGLQKRIDFLNLVIKELKLSNIVAVHNRCELLAHKEEYREKYDYCVARAVAKLNTLCEYCLPFLRLYGYFIAYKSKNSDNELIESGKALSILGGVVTNQQVTQINEIDAVRNLIFIQKRYKTPIKYPRGQNKPKTMPL